MDPMDTIGRVSRQEPIRVVLVVFIGSNPFPPSRYPKKTLGHEMLDVRHRFVTTPVKMMPQGGGRGRTGGGGGVTLPAQTFNSFLRVAQVSDCFRSSFLRWISHFETRFLFISK